MEGEEPSMAAEYGAMISLRGVSKSYGGFELGPLDLEVEPGYVVAVVGPNGSGKSTLFRLMMGLAQPDAGEVRLFGGYPQSETEIKRRVGYVSEVSVGHDDLSARELGAFISHWYPTWDDALYNDLIRRFEIDPRQRFGTLSKGTQRRLAFALTVARRSNLLLLDEPTDGVDPLARRMIFEEISRHVESGERTVVFATHVMEEVRRAADYVAFLHRGRFLGLHEKDALLERWRTLWVERVPEGSLPGVVAVESGTPYRLVTRSLEETLTALRRSGVGIVRQGALNLEEILGHLIREETGFERRSEGPHDAPHQGRSGPTF